MAVTRIELQPVDLLQLLDAGERGALEGRLALEGVQHHPFQQVAQRHVEVFRERLEDLQQALLDLDPGLDALDLERGGGLAGTGGHGELRRWQAAMIHVPMYIDQAAAAGASWSIP